MVYRALRRGAGSSVVAGDKDDLRSRLCHPCGNRSDSRLRYQLDRYPCAAVCVFEVVYQLCQILYRVNIVVRRRGDERHTGGGAAGLCDPRIDLLSRQMTALARLCALSHFYLDFLCAEQVFFRDAETPGGDLLYCAVFLCPESFGIFAALTGVGFAAETVHSYCHALMRLFRYGAV